MNKDKIIKHVIPIILILGVMILSSTIRLQNSDLPITDLWAEQTIEGNIKAQIEPEVRKEHPFLYDHIVAQEVDDRYQDFISEPSNRELVDTQRDSLSLQLKSQLQDDSGQTYLVAIDPYLFYGYGKNFLDCGHAGCRINESNEYTTLRNGRDGKERDIRGVPFVGLAIYYISNLFVETTLLESFFLIPVIMIALSIIPAFFLAKRFSGNLGGLVASLVVVLNGALLGRTPAGFSDTDSANILFPLLIMWLFVLAYDNRKKGLWQYLAYCVGGALSFVAYSLFWSTEHILGLIGLASVVFLVAKLVLSLKKSKGFKEALKSVVPESLYLGGFGLFSLLGLVLVHGTTYITHGLAKLWMFVTIKDVGTTSLFPNVFTTVAEFSTTPFIGLINQLGGILFIVLAVVGLILITLKGRLRRDNYMYAILFIVTLAGTAYSFTKGMRFSLLALPSFAILVGCGVGISLKYAYEKMELDKNKVTVIVGHFLSGFILLLLFAPHLSLASDIMVGEVPAYNDAWDATMNVIKDDTLNTTGYLNTELSTTPYVTTWWDFGHWFVANGISVTFDGGDQGERIHWVGKTLLTNDEDTSVGILRSLNCGQQNGIHVIQETLDSDLILADKVFNDIVKLDKDEAKDYLGSLRLYDNQVEKILTYTHCEDLMPHYFIISEDMVSKASVWSHFGNWNFTRAYIYQNLKDEPKNVAVDYMVDNFGIDKQKASLYYGETQTQKADNWISGWYGVNNRAGNCQLADNTTLSCDNGFIFDLEGGDFSVGGNIMRRLVYVDNSGNLTVLEQDKSIPISGVLDNTGRSIIMDDILADSMFARMFYMNGMGLEHFTKVDELRQYNGQRIQIWKVNYE